MLPSDKWVNKSTVGNKSIQKAYFLSLKLYVPYMIHGRILHNDKSVPNFLISEITKWVEMLAKTVSTT